jgi:hypothetical protein
LSALVYLTEDETGSEKETLTGQLKLLDDDERKRVPKKGNRRLYAIEISKIARSFLSSLSLSLSRSPFSSLSFALLSRSRFAGEKRRKKNVEKPITLSVATNRIRSPMKNSLDEERETLD